MASLRKLQKEHEEINKLQESEEEPSISAQPTGDDYFSWQGTINGPKNTPYEDGVFFLEILFPKDYPFKPPKVKFQTKIYHCNVNEKGEICLGILKDGWSPALNILKVLQAIQKLLEIPDPDTPLLAEIAKLYKDNKDEHDKRAKAYTKKYAQ